MFLRCLPFKSCRSVGGIYCLLLTRIFAKMLKNRIRMRSKQIASILTAFSGFHVHNRCKLFLHFNHVLVELLFFSNFFIFPQSIEYLLFVLSSSLMLAFCTKLSIKAIMLLTLLIEIRFSPSPKILG